MNADAMRVPLEHDVLFAMPLTSAYGGMLTYARILQKSSLFAGGRAASFDTAPPPEPYGAATRVVHGVRLLVGLASELRTRRPRVLYLMSPDYLGFYEKTAMACVARLLGVRTLVHLIGDFALFQQRWKPLSGLHRLMLRRCFDGVVVVSDDSRAAVTRHPAVWLIPNPVDLEPFEHVGRSHVPSARLRVLFLGAVIRDKGPLELIEAAARLTSRRDALEIVIAGAGALNDECRRRILALGLEEFVRVLGPVDEATKHRLLDESDVFVLPSYAEGIPIAMLEAMASGLAVIVTRVGGIPRVIDEGRTGFLIPPRDPDALADRLQTLINDRHLAVRVGDAGRARVHREFRSELVLDRLATCLNAVGQD